MFAKFISLYYITNISMIFRTDYTLCITLSSYLSYCERIVWVKLRCQHTYDICEEIIRFYLLYHHIYHILERLHSLYYAANMLIIFWKDYTVYIMLLTCLSYFGKTTQFILCC